MRIACLYASFMDEEAVEARGVAPLRANPKGVEGNPPAKDPDPGPND